MVAGETIESAIKTSQTLDEKGMVCTMDYLGEFVSSTRSNRLQY
ncbi:hypothetical protein ACQKKK_09480 [Peribacillus sp. NPDC006672]